MLIAKIRSLATKTASVYRAHGSPVRAAVYLGRTIFRRLPVFVERKLATKQHRPSGATSHKVADTLRVAALVPGGIGDHIIAARFFRDLAAAVEPFTLDVFSPIVKPAAWVFAPLPVLGEVYYDTQFTVACDLYSATLDLNSLPHISIGRMPDIGAQRITAVLARMQAFTERFAFFRDAPFPTAGFLAQLWQAQNITRAELLHQAGEVAYGGPCFGVATNSAILNTHGLRDRTYVSVHNGYEAELVTSGAGSTKCYPHFAGVIAALRDEFPGLPFVQIGTHTSVPIDGIDLDLINRTKLTEAAAVVAGSAMHLDIESGMVHIASCLGTPSCVVFGPTPPDYFGYAGNANLRPPRCGGCWWTTPDWMDRCPRGFTEPICVGEQTPLQVAAAARAILRSRLEPVRVC